MKNIDDDDRERRQFERIERALITYYRKLDDNEIETFQRAGLSRNISEGGILLELDDNFMIGDLVALEIKLHSEERPLFVNGRIVRKVSNMFGICFERINEEDRIKFKQYIETRKAGIEL